MVNATELRTGMAIRIDGSIYFITGCEHIKPGKGTAFSRTRLKHLHTGAVIEKTYKASDKLEDVRVERRKAQFQYADGEMYYMMDLETYEQVPVGAAIIGDHKDYIKDSMTLELLTADQGVVGIEMPNFIELEVTQTDPGIRGDTASGGTKSATLESGAVVQVPLFINPGDVLRIDTRSREYVERV